MDVKFKNALCTCAPTKIEGYGAYSWTTGSFEKLQNIPKLPDELFKMISAKKSTAARPQTPTPTTEETIETPPASKRQLDDLSSLILPAPFSTG